MLIIFFDIMGIAHKKFVLVGQTVIYAYYCDILWRLRENLPQTMMTKELAVTS
jgi:hypothetical protein